MYQCAMCHVHTCRTGEADRMPSGCPCGDEDSQKVKDLYLIEENHRIAVQSALVESEGYCRKTRLEEIMDFANRCGFKKLGVAFCLGLSKEANLLCRILKHNSFDVESVVCKSGSIPKEFLNICENHKLVPVSYEPMCNPIGQAYLLNKAKTDLNIIVGLCVGHDSLFIKYSDAPVTVFAAKDRVLAHNPLGAVYLSDSYYKKRLYPDPDSE